MPLTCEKHEAGRYCSVRGVEILSYPHQSRQPLSENLSQRECMQMQFIHCTWQYIQLHWEMMGCDETILGPARRKHLIVPSSELRGLRLT